MQASISKGALVVLHIAGHRQPDVVLVAYIAPSIPVTTERRSAKLLPTHPLRRNIPQSTPQNQGARFALV